MKQRVTFEAWLENEMSAGFDTIERDGKRTFRRIDAEIDDVNRSLQSTESRMVSMAKGLGAAVAGYVAIDRLADWGGTIVDTTAKYQRFYAVLENTLGSRDAASSAFARIEEFATSTPFQVDQLTDSFVKLANQGFTPTMRQMRSLGDLASSTGKEYDQLTEAIIDAQTGEFERLKEFGIRASKSGDQVTFTFKNQKTTVDFTADSIRKYILSLGNAQGVAGSMEKIMGTTGGKISNLKDNIDKLNKNLGDRYRPIIDDSITRTSRFVSILSDWAEVPLSEKLEDEKTRVNILTSELINANTPLERRNEIYTELQGIAPDIVSGISAEAIETEKLKDKLAEYNGQMINKIVLQKQQEELDKATDRENRRKARQTNTGTDIANTIYEAEELLREKGYSKRAKELEGIRLNAEDTPNVKAEKAAKYLLDSGGLIKSYDDGTFLEYDRELERLAGLYDFRSNRTESAEDMTAKLKKNQAELRKFFKIDDPGNTDPDPEDPVDPEDPNGTGTGVGSVLGGISGDNRTMKNIHINIDKLGTIEMAQFLTDADEESMEQFLEKLQQGLMTVLNDTNTMVN